MISSARCQLGEAGVITEGGREAEEKRPVYFGPLVMVDNLPRGPVCLETRQM